MALNYLEIKEISSSIDEKIKGNHLANITLINSSDVVFTFSYYRKEKMIISLNHNYPFIGMIDKEITIPTVLNKLCDELRKNVKDTIILEVKSIDNDRIVEMALQKTDEFYQKHSYYLMIELIPHHPNLVILDEDKKIIFANHYSSLTDKRIIVKGVKYELPESKEIPGLTMDLASYYAFISDYLSSSINKRLEEKYSRLIDIIKRKIKTSNNKTKVLNEEISKAKELLVYQEYGSCLLTLKDDKEDLVSYIKENNVPYDESKSVIDNANTLFKKYKKAKETILKDIEQLELNEALLTKLNDDLCSLKDADESLYLLYQNEYLKTPIPKQEINKLSPFYIELDNTKIAFGRNAIQNEYLTFKKANKDNYFFHIKDYSGSHVVILKNHPNDKDKENAAMLALALANKQDGDVQMVQIKNIKKGQFPGQVIFSSFSVIHINKVNIKIISVLNNVKRVKI